MALGAFCKVRIYRWELENSEMSTKEKRCVQSLHTYQIEGIEIKGVRGHRVIEAALNSKPIGFS